MGKLSSVLQNFPTGVHRMEVIAGTKDCNMAWFIIVAVKPHQLGMKRLPERLSCCTRVEFDPPGPYNLDAKVLTWLKQCEC